MANSTNYLYLSKKLNSYDSYQSFMKGEKDIERLKNDINRKLYSPDGQHLNVHNYLDRISFIVKNIFKLGAVCLAKIFIPSYYSKKFEGYVEREDSKKRYGSLFLTPSQNYCYDSHNVIMPANRIDSKIRAFSLSLENNNRQIKFNKGGVCRGMSDYFIYLYLSSKNFYKNEKPEDLIRKVAEIFKRGAPLQSAFLQEFE
ncbi:hypothetical protein LCGC14_2399180, partial [marine sediment metagenome]